MRIEINKILESNYKLSDKDNEILKMPEEYQLFYKNFKEIQELKEQQKKLNETIDKEISELTIPLPENGEIPEYYWSATEIGCLVGQACSVIGKLATKLGYKDDEHYVFKKIIGIKPEGFQYKYYYSYVATTEIADKYNIFKKTIPNENELAIIINALYMFNTFGTKFSDEQRELIKKYINI